MVGVYGMNAREASEVRAVQGEYLADAVRVHGSGKSCVMDLYAGDAVLHDNRSPLAVNSFRVGKEGEATLDDASVPLGFSYREAEAIAFYRARRGIPELSHVLQCISRDQASLFKGMDCATHQRVLRVIAFGQAEQNVAIGQVEGRPGHQS